MKKILLATAMSIFSLSQAMAETGEIKFSIDESTKAYVGEVSMRSSEMSFKTKSIVLEKPSTNFRSFQLSKIEKKYKDDEFHITLIRSDKNKSEVSCGSMIFDLKKSYEITITHKEDKQDIEIKCSIAEL